MKSADNSAPSARAQTDLNNQKRKLSFDVIILGGGPAGTATALALRAHDPHLSVAIVEQSAYGQTRIGESIPPAAQGLLERLGVWPAFLKQRHLPAYGTCAAWGSAALFEHEFIYQPERRGWHLDRKRFDLMLARQAEDRGVELLEKSKFISAAAAGREGWRLKLESGSGEEIFVDAAFVVDATGRRASFACRQGVEKISSDQLLGVFVLFAVDRSDPLTETYTLVEACEAGWWYSALVPDGRLAVAFMSDRDMVKAHGLNSLPRWLELAAGTRHTQRRLQHTQPIFGPSLYPASSHRLAQISGQRWLAVGDAASACDPLSSAGIMKGLRSGVMAAYAISDYFKGDSSGLAKCEAIAKQEFENYLLTRAYFYRQENRWENSSFWRRRFDYLTLRPDQLLQSTAPAKGGSLNLSTSLSKIEMKTLCRLCLRPRRAEEIVSSFIAEHGAVPDRRIILALQKLLGAGLIRTATA